MFTIILCLFILIFFGHGKARDLSKRRVDGSLAKTMHMPLYSFLSFKIGHRICLFTSKLRSIDGKTKWRLVQNPLLISMVSTKLNMHRKNPNPLSSELQLFCLTSASNQYARHTSTILTYTSRLAKSLSRRMVHPRWYILYTTHNVPPYVISEPVIYARSIGFYSK